MKNLFIIISILSLLGCSKNSQSDADGLIEQKTTAKSIFTNMDNLEKGINSAESDNQDSMTPQQAKIAEMLKPCTITHENPDQNSSHTLFSGEACPIQYLQKTNFSNNDLSISKDLNVKTSEFEKLVKFTLMESKTTSKMTSTELNEHYTMIMKTDFSSSTWGAGTLISDYNFDGTYVGDKNHMDFTFDLALSIKSEKVNLTITANLAGKMVTDNNGNTEANLSSYQCALNGKPVNCEELIDIVGGEPPTKKAISIRSLFK